MNHDAIAAGARLREAREALGLSVEDVARRLRLMQRQIEAMESGAFETLGQPVFVRGFVRNYARLLNLDPEPLLGQLVEERATPAPALPPPAPPRRPFITRPWLVLGLLAMLAFVSIPVGLYWWLNSDAEEIHPVAMIRSKPDTPPEPVPSAMAPDTDLAPADRLLEDTQVAAADASPAPPEASEMAPQVAVPAEANRISLEFLDDAWVEIRDGAGRALVRRLHPAGSRLDVSGTPPFDFVIGNAREVRMRYNDRPVDLSPFIGESVARFSLEN